MLGVDIGVVRNDIHAEMFALRKSTVGDAESIRNLELERLSMIKKDLLPYCMNHEVEVVEKDGEGNPTVTKVMVGPEHKKIEVLLKILEREAKYLGIDMPDTRIQLNIPWEKLSLDQAARIAAGVDLKIIMSELETAQHLLPESTEHIIDAEVVGESTNADEDLHA